MRQALLPSILAFAFFTVLCGFVYSAAVTLTAQTLFPRQAQGSLIERDGKILGSELIGQNYTDPKYFWGRLSATSAIPYNAAASSGSNMGAANPALLDAVKARLDALKQADPQNDKPVPVDLVTASGSGLDPHISPAAAYYQAGRIAQTRHLEIGKVNVLIEKHTESRQFGFLGEARVNVLMLNLDLDGKL